MTTFCVSDLHACDKGPRDNFAFEDRPEHFGKFLDMVEKTPNARLLVLGDLLDWWQVPVGSAIVAHRDLLDRFAAMSAKWVVGNHDNALTALIGTPLMIDHPFLKTASLPFVEEIAGRKFLFMHGHEGDPYCCDPNPGTGEITAIISGMLEDRNKGPFRNHHAVEDEFVGTLETALTIWRTITFQHGRQAEMVEGVEKYRKEKGADVVIYGHTHEPGRIGDYHFNSGSWAKVHDTYVRIEDDGTTNVWEWLGTWPKMCNAKLG